MNADLLRAKKTLENEGYTSVVLKDDEMFMSRERGIKPIIYRLREDESFFCGAAAADKVIGKAAAQLLAFGKVGCVYADVISEPALKIFEQCCIPVEYSKLVPLIRNRDNTGMCPMETRALNIESLDEAYSVFNEIVK